jgi:hypothetical protein
MVSSPPAIFPSSTSVKLTGEFTSLEEPSDDYNIATVSGHLPTNPVSSDLKGESNLVIRRESLDFRSSNSYLDPYSRILARNLTGEVENRQFQRVSEFCRLADCCWPKVKKLSNS